MNDNVNSYLEAKSVWESYATQSSEDVLLKAKKYLKKIPSLVGKGPSVTLILDLKTSRFVGFKGSFLDVFGVTYRPDMLMLDLVSNIYKSHNKLISDNFEKYLAYIFSLNPKQRSAVDLSVVFKYKKNDAYSWLSFRAFKYFSDTKKVPALVILEYTDITDTKKDCTAKFIVYDASAGYIINDTVVENQEHLQYLTPTELEVTKLITKGLSDKEISAVRNITLNTVKQHKKNIFSKLGINKSIELVGLALDNGFTAT